MPTRHFAGRTFDARPDRVDYRDLPYRAPLVSLPERHPDVAFVRRHFEEYGDAWVLDQQEEGACTGFGLAAVINYLLWRRSLEADTATVPLAGNDELELRHEAVWKRRSTFDAAAQRVSMRMLYQMAKIYDEWPGEDYDGSSCRGAMKGWHRHGVCTDRSWRYSTKRFVKPRPGWEKEAALVPLGAYYRVDKDSIADMQAAIWEVGALYASADVHEGWFLDGDEEPQTLDGLPIVPVSGTAVGGHAFALVGYNAVGFVVQNSWGPSWGHSGFAVLQYEDWIAHGADAWVAVLGAPMTVGSGVRTRNSASLADVAGGKAEWWWRPGATGKGFTYAHPEVEPWSEQRAYERTLVLGNEGLPLNRFLDLRDGVQAAREVALNRPSAWLESAGGRHRLAIWAHGGLNAEAASINRVRLLAPYFEANGIYPLFLTWKTGFLESIAGILEDAVDKLFPLRGRVPARGWEEAVREQIGEAKDRSIEAACDRVLIKPVWMQMKQNAAAAAAAAGGVTLLARHLRALRARFPDLRLHLVGHSAGAILLGHLLDRLASAEIDVATLTLYAPACTLRFALEHYVPAWRAGVLSRAHFDLLTDRAEKDDTVSIYGKSLLYLVSRALETVHKMPLLGMHDAWRPDVRPAEIWSPAALDDVAAWQEFAAGGELVPHVHGGGPEPAAGGGAGGGITGDHGERPATQVWDGQQHIPLAHSSFDNDVEVVGATLRRIRGTRLRFEVENLHGF